MAKNLIYDIKDRPRLGKMIVFAIQQLLAIIAATIAVPGIVGCEYRNKGIRKGYIS